ADLARTGDRKGQHVPERKAEIVDQHLAPRLRLPGGGVERGQEIVELAGRGVEPNFLAELLNKPVELVRVLLDKALGVGRKVLDLPRRRRRRKQIGDQVAHSVAVKGGRILAAQRVEPAVELALE